MQVPRPPASLHLNMTLFICDGAGRDPGRAAKKQAAKSAKCRAGLLERSRVTDLWKRATDKEWEERLQPRVVRVERDEKEEGTCKIAEISQVPSDGLGLTSQMGAGKSVKANNGLPSIVIKTAPRRPPGMRRGRKPKPTELGPA